MESSEIPRSMLFVVVSSTTLILTMIKYVSWMWHCFVIVLLHGVMATILKHVIQVRVYPWQFSYIGESWKVVNEMTWHIRAGRKELGKVSILNWSKSNIIPLYPFWYTPLNEREFKIDPCMGLFTKIRSCFILIERRFIERVWNFL